jgi:serine/threonine protein kinase
MPRANETIGPYTLIKKLGKGAFGVVWLAERRTTITTTEAVIKIPLDEDVDLEAIRHEANLWVKASGHPNVLPIIEANIYGDYVVIASEYAPDGSLADWLAQRGGKAPSIESAVEIVYGLLAGLAHLHGRNIIHRDLKPANILFQGNTPRIADFGISRILESTSQSSIVAGTPAYMAPEAFDGKRNAQTDIWSVGVIFYQLLTGRLPFPQTDRTSLIKAIILDDPSPLPESVPNSLREFIIRSLEKNQRHKSVTEMRAALQEAVRLVSSAETDSTITLPSSTLNEPQAKITEADHTELEIVGHDGKSVFLSDPSIAYPGGFGPSSTKNGIVVRRGIEESTLLWSRIQKLVFRSRQEKNDKGTTVWRHNVKATLTNGTVIDVELKDDWNMAYMGGGGSGLLFGQSDLGETQIPFSSISVLKVLKYARTEKP